MKRGPLGERASSRPQEDTEAETREEGDYPRHRRNNCSVNRGAILNSLVRSDTENKYRLPSEVARATTHYFEK